MELEKPISFAISLLFHFELLQLITMNRAIKPSLCCRRFILATRFPVLDVCSREKVLFICFASKDTIRVLHSTGI